MHKFIKQTEHVLNSNSIFFSVDLPGSETDAIAFIEQSLISGKFHEYAAGELTKDYQGDLTIPNLEWSPTEISFNIFMEILVDMLVVSRLHFHDAPYGGAWDKKDATLLVDDFWLTMLIENPKYESKEQWSFYTMPRVYVHTTREERKFFSAKNISSYRPMGDQNNENPLGKYFCGWGGDCFLIFHNTDKVYCLLTNGAA